MINTNIGGTLITEANQPAPPNSDNQNITVKDERDQKEIEARAAIDLLMQLPKNEREAKIASVLDRGIINDRLAVDIPSDLYGEWVRDDPIEIARMETLGFWQDNYYAAKRAIHSDGSSAAKIGDVRYMITMRENKNMIDKIMQERADANMKPKKKISAEEKGFMNDTARDTQGDIQTFSESKQTQLSMDSVRAAMEAANRQTVIK